MAETTYYDSPLTGEELDEAFRKLADLDASVSSAAASAAAANQSKAAAADSAAQAGQDADTAEKAAQTVAANAANIQAVVDNLAAIRAAPAAAQSAAASATAAQQAAQEALGFRTFFSAVTPDENGDLDPSRPMTTPSAQASWTIKSKGDRIASVEVDGFTQQAGSGDPSPENVRNLTNGGIRLSEFLVDGSAVYSSITVKENTIYFYTTPHGVNPALNIGYCEVLKLVSGNNDDFPHWYPSPANKVLVFFFPIDYFGGKTDKPSIVSALNTNPIKCWYQDAGGSGSLYLPVELQGHAYRCQCLELTAPLCEGDKVESDVPSGCDKRIVLDGSQNITQGNTASNWYQVFYNPGNSYYAPDNDYIGAFSTYLQAISTNYAFNNNVSGISVLRYGQGIALSFNLNEYPTCNSIDGVKIYLQNHPLTVWYRSTSYTEQNDISVQLETHNWLFYQFTADTSFWGNPSSNWVYSKSLVRNKKANGAVWCSHFKGVSGTAPSGENQIAVNANGQYIVKGSFGSDASIFNAYVLAQESAGTPITVVSQLSTPDIYAHDPVTLVTVPYTEADEAAAQQLASTPSTLPYIDSADVPMLLSEAEQAADEATKDSTAQPMALAATLSSATPVAGTYVVSSQSGTTVLVSLKAMQDGGDAATLGGMTLEDIKALISDAVTAAVALAQGGNT